MKERSCSAQGDTYEPEVLIINLIIQQQRWIGWRIWLYRWNYAWKNALLFEVKIQSDSYSAGNV